MIGLRMKKIGLRSLLLRGSLGYLILWVLSPILAYGLAWRLLAALAAGVWLLLELSAKRSILLRPNFIVLLLLAYALYTLGIDSLVPYTPNPLRQLQVWIAFFFLLAGESLQRQGREADLRFLFWLVLAILPVWETTTLMGLSLDDHAARVGSRSSAATMELAEQGVGGFGFVYTVVLSLPFTVWMTLNPRALQLAGTKRRRRLAYALVAGNAALGCLMVLRAGYSIAVILMLSGIACALVMRSRQRLRIAISAIFAAMLVTAAWLSVQPLLAALQSATTETQYMRKVQDMQTTLQQGDSVGTVEGRTERYERSARLFLENPVVGTLVVDPVGKHSAFLDRFAQYGGLVGYVYLVLVCYLPWRLLRDSRQPLGLALAFLVVTFGASLLNNTVMQWGVVMYLFSRGAVLVAGSALPASRRKTIGQGAVHGAAHA